MTIPEPKYYPNPRVQGLANIVSNEIVYTFYWEDKILTAKQIANKINERLGTKYSENDVLGTQKSYATNITQYKGKMVTKEMMSFPNHYTYIIR